MPEFTNETEMYEPRDEHGCLDAQYLFDSGLLFLANFALHHYGYAFCVGVDEETPSKVTSLGILKTDDPDGIWFGDEQITEGRRKLRAAGLLGAGPSV